MWGAGNWQSTERGTGRDLGRTTGRTVPGAGHSMLHRPTQSLCTLADILSDRRGWAGESIHARGRHHPVTAASVAPSPVRRRKLTARGVEPVAVRCLLPRGRSWQPSLGRVLGRRLSVMKRGLPRPLSGKYWESTPVCRPADGEGTENRVRAAGQNPDMSRDIRPLCSECAWSWSADRHAQAHFAVGCGRGFWPFGVRPHGAANRGKLQFSAVSRRWFQPVNATG
jgi:hypothetical protein